MFDLINAIVHLPPEVMTIVLILAGMQLYSSYRTEWKFGMFIVVITTEKHDRKTGAIPYSAFEKYGLTSKRLLP